jgi:hypothetical protein
MSVTITALNSTLGAYARQNKAEAFRKALKESTRGLFTTYGSIIDEVPLMRLRTGSVLKPYASGGGFTAASDALVFSAQILKARRCSFDISIVPLDLYQSWIGQVEGAPPGSPFDIPLEQFIMDAITERVIDDLETAIWSGTYNASGTTAAATMSGILTLITAAIASTEIPAGNVYDGEVIDASNAFDQVKGIRALIAPEYRQKEMYCLMSQSVADLYLEAYRAEVGAVVYNKSFDQMYVEGTRAKIIVVPGMGTSQRVIFTPKENLVYGYDVDGIGSNIEVQPFNRTLKIMGDFRAGVNFCDGQVIWTNDQA